MFVCIHACMYVCMYIVCVAMYARMHGCMYVYACVYAYVCGIWEGGQILQRRFAMHSCVSAYVCMCVCMYVCMFSSFTEKLCKKKVEKNNGKNVVCPIKKNWHHDLRWRRSHSHQLVSFVSKHRHAHMHIHTNMHGPTQACTMPTRKSWNTRWILMIKNFGVRGKTRLPAFPSSSMQASRIAMDMNRLRPFLKRENACRHTGKNVCRHFF